MNRFLRVYHWPSCLLGLGFGVMAGWAGQSLLSFDWHPVVAPLDQEQLVVRKDAKGEGQFEAPRSGNRRHRGVDVEAPLGSPVRAIRSGRVVAIGRHRGLGRYVEVEHRHDLQSLYGHLEAVAVDVGDRVRQGQMIATVGKTGNARHPLIRPHLHLEVTRAGNPLDPATLGLAFVEPSGRTDNAHADGGE